MNNNTKSKSKLTHVRKAKRTGAAELVSSNPRRNMAMRVFHNVDAHGCKSSITRHEPLNPQRFVTPINHKYIEYRQPVGAK